MNRVMPIKGSLQPRTLTFLQDFTFSFLILALGTLGLQISEMVSSGPIALSKNAIS